MKIDLERKIQNFKGEPLKDSEGETATLGSVLSSILLSAEEGGKMKLYVLAEKFYKGGEIDIDASDLALVKRIVSTTKAHNILVAGQCELLLEEVK